MAAALFVLTTILTQVSPTGTTYQQPIDYLHQVVVALAYLATLITVAGLHARQRPHQRYGRLGVVGAALTLCGYGLVVLIVVAGIVMAGRVLDELRIVAAVVVLAGSALLGVATLRTRLVPWWCGVLLIVAFPLGDVADQGFAGAEGLLLALLWGSVGAALRRPGSSSGDVAG